MEKAAHLAAGVMWRRGSKKAEDEEENPQNKADCEIEIVRWLFNGKPDGRGQHQSQAEAVEKAFFHRVPIVWSASASELWPSRFCGSTSGLPDLVERLWQAGF